MNKVFFVLFFAMSIHIAFSQEKVVINVKDYGATGDGQTDDTKAFRNALQHLQTISGIKELFVPKGVYLLSRDPKAKEFWGIQLIANLELVGEEKNSTVLKLNPNTTAMTRVVYLQRVQNVRIENLTIDGNCDNIQLQKGLLYQMHGISVNASSNIKIIKCNLINTYGDGIGINGQETPSQNVYVSNCSFNHNLRNGLTLGSGYNGVTIDSSIFQNVKVQPIDTEPQTGDCSNVTITDNTIYGNALNKNIVTLGGYKLKTGTNIRVTNNKLYNCGFQLGNSSNVTLSSNNITYDSSFRGGTKAVFYLLGNNDSVTISNNVINTQNVPVLLCFGLRGNFPKNIHFTQNSVNANSHIPALFTCINVEGAVFDNNKIQSTVKNALLFQLENQSIASQISFSNNTVSNIKTLFDIKNNFKTQESQLTLRKNDAPNTNIFTNNSASARLSRFSGYIINNLQ